MRKTMVTILSLLLVVGFGTSVFAGHAADTGYEYTPKLVKAGKSSIDISGSIRVRGDFRDNTSDFNSESADYKAIYDSRARLKFQATVSPNTMGVIELEAGGTSDDTYTWGYYDAASGTFDCADNCGDGNYKPADMYIRQAYIAHQGTGLLGVLSGVKAGHMLVKLGNGVFYNHAKFGDDAIVLWTEPQKGTEVSLTMVKLAENNTAAAGIGTPGNDDVNAFILGASTGLSGINLGTDITYIDDQDYNEYGYDTKGLHLWNVGLYGDAEVGGAKLYADVEMQSGKAKGVGGGSDMKFKGYAWVVGAKMDIPNSPVSAGLEVGYGSGDKIEESGSTMDTGNEIEGFMTTIGTSGNLGVRQTAFLYDDKIMNAACNDSTDCDCSKAGIANTWYVNLGADADVTSDMNVALDIFYIRAAKAVAIKGALETDGSYDRSKAVGTEVDAKFTYQVDTNLVYYIEAGYMFAGSAYDRYKSYGSSDDADNPYGVRHGLELTF
ncbi:MAG: hypothetical protein HY809_03470 [Nitrospirae bacterium]|nr:hypothetical protein [Nitrospirota bacterium]